MNLRKSYSPSTGLTEVVANSDGLKSLRMSVLRLAPGDVFKGKTSGEEAAFVLLSGICTVICGSKTFQNIGGRREVFDGPGFTVYLPAESEYEVTAQTWMEAALGFTPAKQAGEALLIRPENVVLSSRGTRNWRRDIWDVIAPDFPSQHLIVVEVITPPGNWSSVPPHKHEEDNLPTEIYQEEIYFYRLKPSQGFAMQRIYTDDGSLDEAVVAKNNDAVIVPKGYHPVAVAPGYVCYYLNFLSGKLKGMAPKDDPQHTWLKSFEAIDRE